MTEQDILIHIVYMYLFINIIILCINNYVFLLLIYIMTEVLFTKTNYKVVNVYLVNNNNSTCIILMYVLNVLVTYEVLQVTGKVR